MKLKLHDTVSVLSGDDRGRTGKIIALNVRTHTVLVDGLNTYKRHLKRQGKQEGGIVTLSRPLPVSKVKLVCPHCGKPTKVSYTGQGSDKVRLCRLCHKPITSQKSK